MFIDGRLGGSPRRYLIRPQGLNLRIPDEILNGVVFVGYRTSDEAVQGIEWAGTAFAVSVPTADSSLWVRYLVTVKHIADKLVNRKWCIRYNTEGGTSEIVDGSTVLKVWKHPTEEASVDAAVIEWGHPERALMPYCPTTMFVTNPLIGHDGFGIGDEVFLVGLFRLHPGSAQNLPIVRTGNIVGMPSEPIPAVRIGEYFGPMEGYLIESRSLGGLSGSPVYVRESITQYETLTHRTTGEQRQSILQVFGHTYLLGMAHGHWNIYPDEHNRYDFKTTGPKEDSIALGISIVVPARKILEVLNHPELIQRRAQQLSEWQTRAGSSSTA
jgi:hypothetical protein